MSAHKPPELLDKIADLILAYRPKPKSKGAKKRKKAVKKLAAQALGESVETTPNELAEAVVDDVVQSRERAKKRIQKARQEIEDGALSRKGRFRL
jgi:transcriptional accessory protein Tex/SPT6